MGAATPQKDDTLQQAVSGVSMEERRLEWGGVGWGGELLGGPGRSPHTERGPQASFPPEVRGR